jgi:exodeoxyribonuclease VII large subunit
MRQDDRMWQESECLTVYEVTRIVKSLIEETPPLRDLLVTGEISNFKHHSSGHMYFTLKDSKSRLRCVMFRGHNSRVRFRPEDGLTVIVRGSIGVYEASGDYQLSVREMHPAGQGALFLAFEQLKKKLEAEGLFAEERKRPLPYLPRTVGVVTSPTGAAIRDIISVLRRRNPAVGILLTPCLVQGAGGPASVVAAIELMNKARLADVLIVGRGGGSLEELWTFNDEAVARAIAASAIPVVSAVGHETDFTIADFVADRRAPTPSAAAEMVVPERAVLLRQTTEHRTRLDGAVRRLLSSRRDRLQLLSASPALVRPSDRIDQLRQQVDDLARVAEDNLMRRFSADQARLQTLLAKLDSLSPLATLARGYSICQLAETGDVVRSISQVQVGTHLEVRVDDGTFGCRVESTGAGSNQVPLPI